MELDAIKQEQITTMTPKEKKLKVILFLMMQKWRNEQDILMNELQIQYLMSKRRRFMFLLLQHYKQKHRRRTIWSRPKNLAWWNEIVPEMPPEVWKANFRITRETFLDLCERLRPYFDKRDTNLRKCIPLQKRIAMCIYMLSSNAELRTVATLFGVGKSTLDLAFHKFCNVVVANLMPDFVQFPRTPTAMSELTNGFLYDWQFPQAFAALDGCHVEISPPKASADDYFNSKHFYSIVLLAACDFASRFIYVNVGAPGRNDNADVYLRSSLCRLIENNRVFGQLRCKIDATDVEPVVLGDSAFPLMPHLMKPFPDGPNLTLEQQNFNYRLSRARSVVEDAFDRLKARFCILSKRLEFNIRNVTNIVETCCTLHNICEINGDYCETEWMEAVAIDETHRQPVRGDVAPDDREACLIRDEFVTYFSKLE